MFYLQQVVAFLLHNLKQLLELCRCKSYSYIFNFYRNCKKKLLKTTRHKKKKHNKTVMLARSKLNSIESKISEALICNEISHEDFMVNINEGRNFQELKENIRMMNNQRSNTEKNNLIEEGKKNRH